MAGNASGNRVTLAFEEEASRGVIPTALTGGTGWQATADNEWTFADGGVIANYRAGQSIVVTNSTSNDGTYVVSHIVSDTVLRITTSTLTPEAAEADIVLTQTRALKYFRTLTRNINLEVNELVSEEIRSTGMQSDVRPGTNSVSGSVNYEMSLTSHDDFMVYALRAGEAQVAWKTTGANPFVGGGGWTSDVVLETLTWVDATPDLRDYFEVGNYVTLANFGTTTTTRDVKIITLTENVMTLEAGALGGTNDTGDTDATVRRAGAVGGTGWVPNTTTKTFTFADGGLAAAGYRAGQKVFTANFTDAGNNDSTNGYLIVDATDTVLTVVEPAGKTMVTASADTDATVIPQQDYIDYGNTLRTVVMERRFEDLDTPEYQPFRGVGVDQWSMTVSPESIIGGTFSLVGLSSAAMTQTSLDATPTAASTNSPFASFEGTIYEAAGSSAVTTELTFTVNNNLSTQSVIGSRFSPDLYQGTGEITGTLSLFFEDDAVTQASGAELYNKFFNETETSLMVKLDDPDGTNYIALWFPRLKFTSVPIDPPAEGPVVMQVNFRALEDSDFGTTLAVVRSNT